MATIFVPLTVNGIDLTNASLFTEFELQSVVDHLAQRYTVTDGTYTVKFVGTGFAYPSSGLLYPQDGVLNSVSVKVGATTYLNWTGLNLQVFDVMTDIMEGDTAGLSNRLFATGDTYRLTDGADKVKALGGNDTVNANGGNDEIWGGKGNDQLNGGNGADTLRGEAGADKLSGGIGLDELTGGAGNDQFIFTISGPTNKKTITDFTSGADKLVFQNSVFTGLVNEGALSADDLAFGVKAGDASDRFVYDQATGSLWYDRDGKGGGGQTLIADLQDGAALTAADFLII